MGSSLTIHLSVELPSWWADVKRWYIKTRRSNIVILPCICFEMFTSHLWPLILSWAAALTASSPSESLHRTRDDNDGIHLAVHPTCGKFGGNFTNANSGVNLSQIETIVSFGVSH